MLYLSYAILVTASGLLLTAFWTRLNFFVLYVQSTSFMSQIQKLIMANNIDRAIKLCNAEPHAALPKVVKAGLTRANRTEKEIEKIIAVRVEFGRTDPGQVE